MPRQSRSITGTLFEKELCQKLGYKSDPKKPKIKWNGKGRTNFDKVFSIGFDPTQFYPVSDSVYTKWDIITPSGSKREVKKYLKEDVTNWTLYSEPIIKVADKKTRSKVISLYGNGNEQKAKDVYNLFINKLFIHLEQSGKFQEIQNKLTSNSDGIEFINGFVPKKNILWKWIISKNDWDGFDRIKLVFKINI
jgi:hypothetical protein